jgi:MFS family permease
MTTASQVQTTTAGQPATLHEYVEKDILPSASKVNEYADSEENYKPRSLKFWLIIISVYLSYFLVALDRMIIGTWKVFDHQPLLTNLATAIPAITNTYGTIADIGWYGSAYMLTCAIFNPLFGKVYQLYDTKWTFLVSIFIFEVGSALCGAAPTSAVRK